MSKRFKKTNSDSESESESESNTSKSSESDSESDPNEFDVTVDETAAKPVMVFSADDKSMAAVRRAHAQEQEKKKTIATFVKTGAMEEDPAYMPLPVLVAAINDVQLLERAHKDAPYSNTSTSTELLPGTWALYNKHEDPPPPHDECRRIALRIRQISDTASIQDYPLKISRSGQWSVLAKKPITAFKYNSLSDLVREYRVAAQAAVIVRSMQQPVDMPAITEFTWHGREWTEDPAILETIGKQNTIAYKDLNRSAAKRGCTLQQPGYDIPHVYVSRLIIGPKAFTMGLHPYTRVWFLMDPMSAWARLSHSLPELLSTTPLNRGD